MRVRAAGCSQRSRGRSRRKALFGAGPAGERALAEGDARLLGRWKGDVDDLAAASWLLLEAGYARCVDTELGDAMGDTLSVKELSERVEGASECCYNSREDRGQ